MFNRLFNKPIRQRDEVKVAHDLVTLPTGAHVLRLRCSGYYPTGCAGAPVADKILQAGVNALERTKADGVLLDISDLEYEWGDDLLRAFNIPDEASVAAKERPLAVIVGPKCQTAVQSLLEDGLDDWREANLLFFDEVTALDHIASEILKLA